MRRLLSFSVFLAVLFIPLSFFGLSRAQAENLPLGAACDTQACNDQEGADCGNPECRSNDCEDSSQEQADDDFCDCDGPEDCAQEYGTQQGEIWECIDGAHASYDLDYCQSNIRGRKFPIEPREASALDYILDPGIGADEIQQLAKAKPVTRITIPGVSFTDPEVITENGKVFLSIPFFGQYLAGFYKYFVAAVIVIAIVKIIDSSIIMLFSRGRSEVMQHAKEGVGGAIVGLIIAIASYSILYTINPQLVQFKNLKVPYVQEVSLAELLESANSEVYNVGPVSTKSCDPYDDLFQKYAPCLGSDWKVLKAIALVESGCKASIHNEIGFVGMAQTKPEFCESIFKHAGYPDLVGYCTIKDLEKPEVGIAVIAAMQKGTVKMIKKYCPDAPSLMQGAAFHAFHNVPAAGQLFIRGGCRDKEDFVAYFREGMYKEQSYINTKPFRAKWGHLLPNKTAYLRAIGDSKITYAITKAGAAFETMQGNVGATPTLGTCPLTTKDPFFQNK